MVAYDFCTHKGDISKLQVNHLDGNKFNLYYKNLEYTTKNENIQHAYDSGLMKKGKDHHLGKYDDNIVHKICKHLENGDEIYIIISDILNDNNISRSSIEYIRMRSYIKKLRQSIRNVSSPFRLDITSQYNIK